ncbi:ABC transporter ATP-binding protein [Gordonia sp. CPCC 206044]|uniref:dipeptide ABC transporter ATP-binding protein n=1 Tax=Gordonia sp. CPCC 206044 TaxID=3140793 RepID=UPI003AF33303
MSENVLSVSNLSVDYRTATSALGGRPIVDDISFDVRRGQVVAVVGQSGSGKSTIARAILGLLPHNGRIVDGSVALDDRDITHLTEREWRGLRGRTIGFVPQDPLGSLDPLKRIGDQVAEVLITHGLASRRDATSRAVDLLDRVGIVNPEAKARHYPHELSGGQLQRALIAQAIAGDPELLIADEPTSALDVTVQRRILDLLDDLRAERGLGIIFITHDLALAENHSDRVVVLRNGIVREQGNTVSVLRDPTDDYTRQLIADAPALSPDKFVRDRPDGRSVLDLHGVSKAYGHNLVLDDVTFSVTSGSVHALVGESGSGKSTLARILAGLTPYDAGRILVEDDELRAHAVATPRARRARAHVLQLVQQNPLASLDPRLSIADAVAEPLVINRIGSRRERRERAVEELTRVGLPADIAGRRPLEISGGQRQRVALARALILGPRILVLDEPTSALDVTVQAQTVDLLLGLQGELDLTLLFISHDLNLVRQISDDVSVLQQGRLVETGPTREVFDAPEAAYTQRLLAAVPRSIQERAA